MSEYERIISNVNTSMAMEGMELDNAQKEAMMDCLSGRLSYKDAVRKAIEKYQQPVLRNG